MNANICMGVYSICIYASVRVLCRNVCTPLSHVVFLFFFNAKSCLSQDRKKKKDRYGKTRIKLARYTASNSQTITDSLMTRCKETNTLEGLGTIILLSQCFYLPLSCPSPFYVT